MLKKIYRLIKYKGERLRTIREPKIARIQDKLLSTDYNPLIKKLVVTLIDGADYNTGKEKMSGGIISIISIHEESKRLLHNKSNTQVICCTVSNEVLLLKFNNFPNTTSIFRFSQIASYFKELEEIVIHIPEYHTAFFLNYLTISEKAFFSKIKLTHFNILNQNIKLMPELSTIKELSTYAKLTTVTTAHQQYCNQTYRDFYGIPLHKLSVWISPEQYKFVSPDKKENLLVYSPEVREEKARIINKLQDIKGIKIQEINGLSYTEFKELISKAKWSVTFGEGLDGYFIEPVFSGSISFAIYNKDFFTEDFKNFKTVYSDYDDMYNNIVKDIELYNNNNKAFIQYQQQEFDICAEMYSSKVYKQNIEKFYNHEFTFS